MKETESRVRDYQGGDLEKRLYLFLTYRSLRSTFQRIETFEKCSILFKIKEGENFNRRNTLSISRIKIGA